MLSAVMPGVMVWAVKSFAREVPTLKPGVSTGLRLVRPMSVEGQRRHLEPRRRHPSRGRNGSNPED
jgi:hypothetical protein